MDVGRCVWQTRARKYDQNGPSIHTYTARCRFEKGRFFRVCLLLPMQAAEIELRTYITYITKAPIHTYIHTYIHTNKLTTRQFGFCTGFYTTSKLEFHVCLPMPAEEIDTYISKFVNLGISISTARATFFDENVQKMTKT